MLIRKMYNLEKSVISHELDSKNIDTIQYTVDELNYIKSAIAIPYNEMIEYINYYYRYPMDEEAETFFISDLSKKYDLQSKLVIKRFHSVERLCKSKRFGKKLKQLYNDDNKKYIKKPYHNN